MEIDGESKLQKSKKAKGSAALNFAASIVAIIAVALLVSNIIYYQNTVNQYVAQGYPVAEVIKQLIPSQLLPGIFDPVAIYGGIAIILFGISMINKKCSQCLALLTKANDCLDAAGQSILQENVIAKENIGGNIEDTDDNKS
jgi:hypothetical protein